MTVRIQIRRGTDANLPTSSLLPGEALWSTDRGTLTVAADSTTTIPVTVAIDKLDTLAAAVGSDDLIMVHDASAADRKEKKMTINEFKTALNIPASSTDELVAVVDGGSAGYIWGTTGDDGIFRMGDGLDWTKDSGNGFVTIGLSAAQAQAIADKLDVVATDASLSGDGTAGSPLSVSIVDGGEF